MSTTPVIGGVFSSSEVLKNQVFSSLSYSDTLTRDAVIFTIAGELLDAYILVMHSDAKTKARVVAPMYSPAYAITLDHSTLIYNAS